jgi:hypothetical protein
VAGHGEAAISTSPVLPEHRGEGFFAKEQGARPGHDFAGTYYLDHVKIRDHQIITAGGARALSPVRGGRPRTETEDPGLLAMMDRVEQRHPAPSPEASAAPPRTKVH